MDCYCVKCRKHTKTSNIQYDVSKNNRALMKGICQICNKKKSKFISMEEAKKGGFIFTLPTILAGIGAAGSLAGGAASIANAVNKSKAQEKQLVEIQRHNKAMETKSGKGLFLKPSLKGKGLYLKPYKK